MRSLGRRLLGVPLVVWGAATLVFVVLRIVPGDAVANSLPPTATLEQKAEIRRNLGLDQSLLTQYGLYLKGLVRGDLGSSFSGGQSVTSLLGAALPVTIELALASGLVLVVVGLATGMLAAARSGTWMDTATRTVATVLFSMPWFFLGVSLIVVFSVYLGWLPSFGRFPPGTDYTSTTGFVPVDVVLQDRYDLLAPWAEHLLLPAVTVGLTTAGFLTRITRASFVETMSEDFVRTARAKGMGRAAIFWREIFRNASLPIVTILGLQVGALLGGAVVTEAVFSYPGIGRLMVSTIASRDYPVVQGAALVIALAYVVINVLTDASYALLDPRLRR
ncbi:ABC transporter permease [uncultured Friedmanniella sp.]|uniref:ABC transporter permease n=1 Tax=uncultured Friedmanniella sp. TaxID=335381 RepID=UPI0035CB97B7